MALVDYGSDSETEAAPPPPIVPPPKPSTKRAKGPVRILLDLPKPSTATAAPAEPAPKRAKFVPGSTGGGGLAAMLPKPKNESVELRLERSLGAASGSAFVPHTIAKGVKKAETAAAVDFFGLSAATPTASTSTLPPISKPSMTISSAPLVESSSFGAPPTAKDPYPGFMQDDTGTWVAKDIATYEAYLASVALSAEEELQRAAPKGFDAQAISSGMIEVDARKSREAWENRPGQEIPRPGSEALEQLKALPKATVKKSGKSRHQLSSLLAEAQQNRAEMEEKFAQGRANRKSAGNKYGF